MRRGCPLQSLIHRFHIIADYLKPRALISYGTSICVGLTISLMMPPPALLLPIQEPRTNGRPTYSGPFGLRELKRGDIRALCLFVIPACMIWWWMLKATFLMFTSLVGFSIIGMIGMRLVLSLSGVSNNHPYVILIVVLIVLTMGFQKSGIRGDSGGQGYPVNGTRIQQAIGSSKG